MIPLLGREAVRAIDRDAVERLGVPSIVLMENAGRGAFDCLQALFPAALDRVLIVGGPGQNGGDGWVVARHLHCAGHAPHAVLIGDAAKLRADAAINWRALAPLGVSHSAASGPALDELAERLAASTLVVDALFGTGLDRPLGGVHAEAIRLIEACGRSVVSLDLPSGVDADTGAVLGVAIGAQHTLTFAAHKRGLEQYPGCGLAGRVHRISIGVPGPADAMTGLIEATDVAALLPRRAADAHKGSAGHVLVIAGSAGHTGAAVLCGLGALRSGAGLCTIAPRRQARPAIEAKVLELMTADLPEGEAGLGAALALAEKRHSAVVGPGLGVDDEGSRLSRELALRLTVPTVLDADALTAIAGEHERLREARGPRVLTPHPGEAARVLGITSAQVQADRYGAAERLARQSGCVVVLKGARTVIADPGGRVRVSPTGTPAMAVGGTGDVLSGVIAAMLASSLPAFEAAIVGVYVHGLAGELAAGSDRGLFASELAAALPRAIERCRAAPT